MKFLQKPRVLSCLPVTCKKIAVANRMKSMREELRKINKEFQDFNFLHGATSTCVAKQDDVRETASRLPEKKIVGRDGEKQEIINLLSAGTNNDETVIVAIHGLGGMGKSTLAQLVLLANYLFSWHSFLPSGTSCPCLPISYHVGIP